MTAHDPDLSRKAGWLSRWRDRRSARLDEAPTPDGDESTNLMPHDPRDKRRRQVLADVSSFLLTHRLEVNTFTLAVAHDVITGANPRLAVLIEEQVEKRAPVTLGWLDEAARKCGRSDGAEMLAKLMSKLESSIEEFGSTTRDARHATSEYHDALEAHVGELEQVGKAGVVITELAAIARVMLDRTREIEEDMARSEQETLALRQSLEAARREAEIDHLTGLPNRRAFEASLKEEHAAAIANDEALTIAFCDVDDFKRINDRHGHAAGDRILKTIARTLAKISDDRCHVARHGGEEFVVLFRGETHEAAFATLDGARTALGNRKLVNRANDIPFGRITFSAGMADVLAYDNPREALKAADEALYAAKAAGKDRIVWAGEVTTAE